MGYKGGILAFKVAGWLFIAFLIMPSKWMAIKLACGLGLILGLVWVGIAVSMALLGWVVKTPKPSIKAIKAK